MSAASYGKAMIESRKRADNAYKAMDAVIANDKKILQIANFEITTANKIERLTRSVRFMFIVETSIIFNLLIVLIIQKEAERLKAQNEATINHRRQQLADLYNSEIEVWRAETISRVETQEDRKARLTYLCPLSNLSRIS